MAAPGTTPRDGLRQLLFWALVLVFSWLVIGHLAELEEVAWTLRQGQWAWVLLAAALQFAFFVITAWQYQTAFALVSIRSELRHLLPLVFGSLFINATAPAGGAAGVALFVNDAARRRQPPGRATAGFLLVVAGTFATFCLILLLGLSYLLSQQHLNALEVVASLLMFLYVGALGALLLLGYYRPAWLRAVLEAVQSGAARLAGWLRQEPPLPAEWARNHTAEYASAARQLAERPRQLLLTALIATLGHLVALASLYAVFRAFYQPPDPGVLLVGYTMTFLFTIISPTPNGAGVVEALVPTIYIALGIAAAPATAITLAYRGLNYWLPLLIGFLLLRRLDLFQMRDRLPSRHMAWPPAILTALMGALNLVTVMTPIVPGWVASLQRFVPLPLQYESDLVAILTGLLLLAIAYGLARRSRLAWQLALLVLAVSVVVRIAERSQLEEALAAMLLAVYLVAQRRLFTNRRSEAAGLDQTA
jgi:phosphatidylglycerol lysyltransferase